MKNVAISALMLGAISLSAQERNEEKNTYHFYNPRVFNKIHREGNYRYTTQGIGMQYHLYQDKGVNLTISSLTNLSNLEHFAQAELELLFRYEVSKNLNFYPTFSYLSSSHKQETEFKEDHFIQKAISYMGFGWEYKSHFRTTPFIEICLSKDMFNSVLVIRKDSFWGAKYSNPFGARGKIGMHTRVSPSKFIHISTSYAKTFSKCYWDLQTEIAFKWGF